MSNWITKEVQEILHRPGPVRGFAFRVTESPDGVFLWVSAEELSRYNPDRQQDIGEWLVRMLNDIRRMKIPCYIQKWER
jgi:hypothetical protein